MAKDLEEEDIVRKLQSLLQPRNAPQPISLPDVSPEKELKWKRSLVISVLSKERIRPAGLVDWIGKMWKPASPWSLLDFPNDYFLLCLQGEDEVTKICSRAPWFFNNDIVLVQGARPNTSPSAYHLNSVDLWMRIYDLPQELLDIDTVMLLASQVGNPILPHKDIANNWSLFARIKISLNIFEPLPTEITVNRNEGITESYELAFERITNFCHFCGMLGHKHEDCSKLTSLKAMIKPSMSNLLQETLHSKLDFKYGDWLSVNGRAAYGVWGHSQLVQHGWAPPYCYQTCAKYITSLSKPLWQRPASQSYLFQHYLL